ncbi:MAG: hypothetical protein IJV88_01300 [Ruminococcus sp.]|nr:hypothetical protein [Ruminococcus sp.]
MFAKLLKYDTRAVFKYWWIGAVASLFIAVMGGVCIQIVDIDYTEYEVIKVLASIGLIFAIIGITLLPFFTLILVIVRYYKHFFTDEGYLTFTLPVKKTSLLDSKVATTFLFSFAALLVTIFNAFVMLSVGIPEDFLNPNMWEKFFDIIGEIYKVFGAYGIPYTLLAILIISLSTVVQALFIFVCVTLAAVIAKKHKVLMAIGLYYGINMILSFGLQIMAYGGIYTVFSLVSQLPAEEAKLAVLLLMVGTLGLIVLAISAMYLFMLYLLDKRLNLE